MEFFKIVGIIALMPIVFCILFVMPLVVAQYHSEIYEKTKHQIRKWNSFKKKVFTGK